MTEGPGVTAASVPVSTDAGAQAVPEPALSAAGAAQIAVARPAQAGHAPSPPAGDGTRWPDPDGDAASWPSAEIAGPDHPEWSDPAELPEPGQPEGPLAPSGAAGSAEAREPGPSGVRVDARRLEAALLELRRPIVSVPLTLEAPDVAEARAERRKLVNQIDDYLLPRLRQSGAPILVALVGSTGAGKSTLLNSIAGNQVSATGIRRPTTNSPVLACHPGDVHWFAENVFLPTLPRVRQEGLAMPGRDGLLVLAASDGMPKGIALLDTPDIDSVVRAHREFAHQFLDASDLWLFMTTSRRYADAAVWDLLLQARDRGAALGLVLSRVPPASVPQLTSHFDAMLQANGLGQARRFLIEETVVEDARLPAEVSAPIRQWLEETAAQDDRRVAVLSQTMSGVLDTFRARIPILAAHADAQLSVRADLRASVQDAYAAALADVERAAADGSLLHGEILARWQDYAGTGDLLRTLRVRRGRGKQRVIPVRAKALSSALRSGLESLVGSAANRAAETAADRWQQHPAGRALLAALAGPAPAGAPGGPAQDAGGAPEPRPAEAAADVAAAAAAGAAVLARSSPDLATRSARAVSAWQDHVIRLVRAQNVTKRSVARVVSFDDQALALALTIGVLTGGSGGDGGPDGARPAPQGLLTSLFGAGLLRDIGAAARLDLRDRVSLLLNEEMRRFTELIDAAGDADPTAATQLYQASYGLEAAR